MTRPVVERVSPPAKKKQQTKINTVHPPKYVWIWNDLESSQTRDLYFRINNPTNFRSSGLPPKKHPLPPPPKKKHKNQIKPTKNIHPSLRSTHPFPAKTPAHQHLPLWLCSRARKFLHASRHQKHVPRDAVALARHSTSRSTKAFPVPPVPPARSLALGVDSRLVPLPRRSM